MDKEAIISELRSFIQGFLETKNIDLVDLIYRHEGRDLVLRILVDRPDGGITLDDCTCLNADIGRILDEKNIIQERYILEVASPGLDRPLKTKSDFCRCITRITRFFLSEAINGKIELTGIIERVGDASVYVVVMGEKVEIPFLKIRKAKQIIQPSAFKFRK
jgi:ribosome maturation factor RimP